MERENKTKKKHLVGEMIRRKERGIKKKKEKKEMSKEKRKIRKLM